MHDALLDILACPLCRGKLLYRPEVEELICRKDYLAYPIQAGIPVMMTDKARVIALEEYETLFH